MWLRRRPKSVLFELHGAGCKGRAAPRGAQVRPPMPPAFFFVIDVSHAAVASGVLAHVCRAIRASLDRLPGGERTRIGFLTFDTALHFYNLKAGLTQPQMMARLRAPGTLPLTLPDPVNSPSAAEDGAPPPAAASAGTCHRGRRLCRAAAAAGGPALRAHRHPGFLHHHMGTAHEQRKRAAPRDRTQKTRCTMTRCA
jgi:hypothetical protein